MGVYIPQPDSSYGLIFILSVIFIAVMVILFNNLIQNKSQGEAHPVGKRDYIHTQKDSIIGIHKFDSVSWY